MHPGARALRRTSKRAARTCTHARRRDVLHIVTEYTDGGTLESAILDVRGAGNNGEDVRFAEPHLLGLLVQVVSSLRYIHDKGIMHRDLSTSNIFLSCALSQLHTSRHSPYAASI